jgi:hypothetical protein
MYVHRKIRVTAKGKAFEGLRTIVRISKAGGNYLGTAEVMIYGLTKSDLNMLSTLGMFYRPQTWYPITIEAGDDRNGMSLVFSGTVQQAWADLTNMPDVPMYLLAQGTTAPANTGTTQPTSTGGLTPIVPLLQKLAQAGGMTLENNGVNTVIDGIYHWGSPWKQIKEICDACRIDVVQEDNVVAIWPEGQNRNGDTLLVSKKTGMRDAPIFTQYGVVVKVEFSRAIKLGTLMQVQSEFILAANGTYWIGGIDYDLAAELPGGNWFSILSGVAPGAPVSGLFNNNSPGP